MSEGEGQSVCCFNEPEVKIKYVCVKDMLTDDALLNFEEINGVQHISNHHARLSDLVYGSPQILVS